MPCCARHSRFRGWVLSAEPSGRPHPAFLLALRHRRTSASSRGDLQSAPRDAGGASDIRQRGRLRGCRAGLDRHRSPIKIANRCAPQRALAGSGPKGTRPAPDRRADVRVGGSIWELASRDSSPAHVASDDFRAVVQGLRTEHQCGHRRVCAAANPRPKASLRRCGVSVMVIAYQCPTAGQGRAR